MSSSHPFPPEYDDDPRSDRQRPAHDQLRLPRFRVPGPQDAVPANAGDDADPRGPHTQLNPQGKAYPANIVANQKPSQAGNVELTAYGYFPTPAAWADEKKEVEAMIKNNEKDALDPDLWSPHLKDFAAVSRGGFACADFIVLLANVVFTDSGQKRNRGTVKRINVITHGNPDLIAFKGTIVPEADRVNVTLRIPGAISLEFLEHLLTPGLTLKDKIGDKELQFTLKDIRDALAPTAEFFIYSCRSGAQKDIRDKLANVLQVTVHAFKDKIAFCPEFHIDDKRVLDRKWIAVGKCDAKGSGKQKTSDFHKLKADRSSNPKP